MIKIQVREMFYALVCLKFFIDVFGFDSFTSFQIVNRECTIIIFINHIYGPGYFNLIVVNSHFCSIWLKFRMVSNEI